MSNSKKARKGTQAAQDGTTESKAPEAKPEVKSAQAPAAAVKPGKEKAPVVDAAALAKAQGYFQSALDCMGAAAKNGREAVANLVRAAIVGGKDGFETARQAAYKAIVDNVDNVAVALDCDPTTDGQKYVVPGTLRTQVMWIQSALKHGNVSLGTVENPATSGVLKRAYENRPGKAASSKAATDGSKGTAGDGAKAATVAPATIVLPEGMEAKQAREAIKRVCLAIAAGADSLEGEVLAVVHARLYDLSAYLEAEARDAAVLKGTKREPLAATG